MTFDLIQAKSIFQSTTFWGAVVSLFFTFAPAVYGKLFGATTPQATIVSDILVGIGFLVTVWGRLTAKQVATFSGGPVPPGKVMSGTKG
jgi:uncharacterized membrane protein